MEESEEMDLDYLLLPETSYDGAYDSSEDTEFYDGGDSHPAKDDDPFLELKYSLTKWRNCIICMLLVKKYTSVASFYIHLYYDPVVDLTWWTRDEGFF